MINYKFQDEAVRKIIDLFTEHKHVGLSFYTGSGKTNIFLKLCLKLIKDNPKVRIGVSSYLTIEIKNQTYQRAKALGLGRNSVLIYRPEDLHKEGNIFIFNPQSIFRQKHPDKFDYLIIDECHAGLDDTNVMLNSIMNKMCRKDAKLLLASATIWDVVKTKRFSGMPVLKRSMALGLKDGLISDVVLATEKSNISLKDTDFTRDGEVKDLIIAKNLANIKAHSIGKLKNIISRYNKKIGPKALVICPPGNNGEIAREMADIFNGEFFLAREHGEWGSRTQDSLDKFKTDADTRFLFVVHKCQVGFDYPELSSIIDLTMTRNIKSMVQRLGRVARKHGDTDKYYFYVHDSSIDDNRLEWLLGTTIDFSCGNYDGWSSRTTKYRPLYTGHIYRSRPSTIRISEIIKSISEKHNIKNKITLRYIDSSPPKIRTLRSALAEAGPYANRHELFKANPSLYKWFRLNGLLDELNKIHPLMKVVGKWNEQTVTEALKHCWARGQTRCYFYKKYSGALYWIESRKRFDLVNKYLPAKFNTRPWTDDLVMEAFDACNTWGEFRKKFTGARSYLNRMKRASEFRDLFLQRKAISNKFFESKESETLKKKISKSSFIESRPNFSFGQQKVLDRLRKQNMRDIGLCACGNRYKVRPNATKCMACLRKDAFGGISP